VAAAARRRRPPLLHGPLTRSRGDPCAPEHLGSFRAPPRAPHEALHKHCRNMAALGRVCEAPMDVHNPIECLHGALQPVDRWVGAPMAHLAARMRPLEAALRQAPVQICAAWTMLRQAGRALTRLGAFGPALVSSLPIAAARLAHPSLPRLTQCTP